MNTLTQQPPLALRPVWALFQPLTNELDPVQLWSSILDMMIGGFQVVEKLNEPISGAERHSQADYDQAVRVLGRTPEMKTAVTVLINKIYAVIAKGLQVNSPRPDDTLLNIPLGYAQLYDTRTNKKQPVWYDFFGDFHYWLHDTYARSALIPCAADVRTHDEWAKAQIGRVLRNNELSLNNRLLMLNNACGSGRGTLAIHALAPGCFNYSCESDDLLHCKYTVLNMLLHGCHGQVTLVDKQNAGQHLRTWDVNRWLFHVFPYKAGLDLMPHVFDAPKELSYSYRENYDTEGFKKAGADEKLLEMQLDMMNRLSEGLGLNLSVTGTRDMLFIDGTDKRRTVDKPTVAPAKGKELRKKLFAGLQQAAAKKKEATTLNELFRPTATTGPTEPLPVAPPVETPRTGRRSAVQRRG